MEDARTKSPIIQNVAVTLLVAAIVALTGSFFSIRDTVREHSLRLDSLSRFQNAGRRFTWDDGEDLKKEIRE